MGSDWTETVEGILTSLTTTVTGEDVAAFARLSGDDYEAHTDPDFMSRSSYGQPIAHGALLVGYMSAAATRAIRAAQARGNRTVPVSLGYDRLRFVAPVFFGDAVTVTYRVKTVDPERRRSLADVIVANQAGETVAVAEHVMKWLHPDAN
ncbi:MaoC family dehydratase [Devosia nitrariae]|uniref:MaoC family dehydratase n=1 Tax=Devosia nitrariae TaxID=2071872 RepID=A0ABQ5W765_9HYPH|nr:MaoC/PaaZ C-terminal domain-containing protein [Devosia nitrariae]GLQ55619.1 MaoC family dehydratase [Devosia nitrariae]